MLAVLNGVRIPEVALIEYIDIVFSPLFVTKAKVPAGLIAIKPGAVPEAIVDVLNAVSIPVLAFNEYIEMELSLKLVA